MTPEARIATAAELLERILAGQPVERELTGWARRSRFAGSKDRQAIRDLVFDALRRKRSLAALGGGETGRGLMIGLIRDAGGDPDAVFTGQGYAPSPITDPERAGSRPPAEGGEALDLPDWLVPPLQAALGPGLESAALAMRHRAPVHLRVNVRKIARDQCIATLSSEGVDTRPHPLCDTALEVVSGARQIAGSQAYRSGLVELQDAASQAVSASIPLSNGLKVLDFCAGGGGKALALAARADVQMTCHDIDAGRMKDIPARADRAGVRIRLAETKALEQLGPFDIVLCDAPCSGSGTWRRSPEGKWSLTPERLADLNAIQSAILEEAARLVAPGGRLVYVTCSLLRAENEDRITGFLAAHPGWSQGLTRRIGLDEGADGFFLCHLQKP